MGSGLVNEESAKVEHAIILAIAAGVIIHIFSNYSVVNLDAVAFVIFAAMCFAGYMALKTAQEIVMMIEEHRQRAYETLKTSSYLNQNRDIAPVAFQNNTKNLKYVTSLKTVL